MDNQNPKLAANKETRRKIFCTFPFGYLLLGCVLVPCLIAIWAAIIALPKAWAWVLLGLAVLCLAFMFYDIKEVYINFLVLNSHGVKHRKIKYNWDNVFITMDSYRPKSFRYALYMVYFSDHFLSKEEINSKNIRKQKFYMALTKKRVQYLFENYDKAIMVIDTYSVHKKLLALVEAHNSSVLKGE